MCWWRHFLLLIEATHCTLDFFLNCLWDSLEPPMPIAPEHPNVFLANGLVPCLCVAPDADLLPCTLVSLPALKLSVSCFFAKGFGVCLCHVCIGSRCALEDVVPVMCKFVLGHLQAVSQALLFPLVRNMLLYLHCCERLCLYWCNGLLNARTGSAACFIHEHVCFSGWFLSPWRIELGCLFWTASFLHVVSTSILHYPTFMSFAF